MQAVIMMASQQLLEHGEFENLFVALECLGVSSFDLSRLGYCTVSVSVWPKDALLMRCVAIIRFLSANFVLR